MAFFRKHTEALLRRYMVLSVEMGRAPSILGNVVFRGRTSSYRMSSFEDSLIFIFDVEKCLGILDSDTQTLIAHIGLQEFTYSETATLLDQSVRSVIRIYNHGLDRLTRSLLDADLLKPDDSSGLSRKAPVRHARIYRTHL
uniref:RNA polymerase sigma-70 region 4 domain-containing protein n=2 Tax=Paracidobacterium acidisoli TaxID=2303751 RepID=A0A372IMQ0_9BACT